MDLPPLGFGTGNTEPEPAVENVTTALDVGYRLVDTAQKYGTEEAVGEALAASAVPREDVVVATKVDEPVLGHDDVLRTAEESRERLGVETIDLLYVHWPSGEYDAADTLPAFDALVDDGVIDHVGVCNFTVDLLEEARDVLDAPLDVLQVECHPLLPQDELRAYAADHDISVVAYCPLMRGAVFGEAPELEPIAEKHGVSTGQVSLAWLMARDVVPIPKGSGDHIAENHAALDVALDDEDLATLDAIEREHRVVDPPRAAWNQ